MSAISLYIYMYMPVSSRLQRFFRTPVGRWLRFSLYNLPTTVIGAGLFYSEVHYLGQSKLVMHAANFPLMTTMTFCVNRQLPEWKCRQKSRTSGLGRWTAYSLAKWGGSNLLFILLAGILGLPYMGVSLGLVATFGIASYLMNDRKVFPKEEETANGVRPG